MILIMFVIALCVFSVIMSRHLDKQIKESRQRIERMELENQKLQREIIFKLDKLAKERGKN